MSKNILIGVAWPYVNGELHIGHLAGYLLPADIFARFHRFLGNNVLMVSGSDCYGTPITIEADKKGVSPEIIVREYHEKNVNLFNELGISFDLYTKTSTDNHKSVTQAVFLGMMKKNLIFKNFAKQYYSRTDKRFLPDRYVEGVCPHCNYDGARSDQCDNCGKVLNQGELKNPKSKLSNTEVELRDSEHYFIDWPKLEPFLKNYFKKRKKNWRTWIASETEGWLKRGLQPRAITRDLNWGIALPVADIPKNLRISDMENKRIYVWFDAVLGYLSASIEWAGSTTKNDSWKDWWYNNESEHYYFMGKDNLVFHALFLPGELYGYDESIHLPDVPVINQFLNLEGHKFSKSRGVIINSDYLSKTYGNDPVRFYLASIMPENHDTNFSWLEFVDTTNNVLIGTIGNFINRNLTLAKNAKMNHQKIEQDVETKIRRSLELAKNALLEQSFKKYLGIVVELADFGNKYLSKKEPWMNADDSAKFNTILSNSTMIVLGLQAMLNPLLPETYSKLQDLTGVNFNVWPSPEDIKQALDLIAISNVKPLFNKIDPEIIETEKEKLNIPPERV